MQAAQVDTALREMARMSNNEPGLSSMLHSKHVTSEPERLAGRGAAIAKRIWLSAASPTFSRSTVRPCSAPGRLRYQGGRAEASSCASSAATFIERASITLTRGSSESRKRWHCACPAEVVYTFSRSASDALRPSARSAIGLRARATMTRLRIGEAR